MTMQMLQIYTLFRYFYKTALQSYMVFIGYQEKSDFEEVFIQCNKALQHTLGNSSSNNWTKDRTCFWLSLP